MVFFVMTISSYGSFQRGRRTWAWRPLGNSNNVITLIEGEPIIQNTGGAPVTTLKARRMKMDLVQGIEDPTVRHYLYWASVSVLRSH